MRKIQIGLSVAFLLLSLSPLRADVPQAGLVLHLDSSSIKQQGGPVAVWPDISGKGHDVRQADPAQQPRLLLHALAGKPVVVFTGQQCLDGPPVLAEGTKNLTFVAVWKRQAADGSQSIVEQASPGGGRRAALLTVSGAYGFNGESNDQHNLLPFRPGLFAVSVLRLAPDGRVTLFHNGYGKSGLIDIGRQNTGADRLRIGTKIVGGIERLDGSIAEILIYDRALSDDEAQELTSTLVKKWGIKVEPGDPEAATYEAMIRQNAANSERYTDVYRPQYHFTPIEGWMNDPNGLTYFRGQWELFYQHNNSPTDSRQAWGHAVSKDLLHWQHLVPAIRPDEKGNIWSGSAVVDEHDTSGFFGGKPGLVCIYALMNPAEGGRQDQAMAYSPDGIHFTKYAKNPIIPQLRYLPGEADSPDFRDPKVFWHEPTHRWVMIVAGGKVRFFSSPNLRDWTFESINPTIETECPDLFEMPVEGEPGKTEWVLSGAGRWYMLGDFNGKVFTPHSDRIPVNYGPDFYAAQSWNDAPDGRRIMIAWMYSWGYDHFPGRPGGGMTIPLRLTLRRTPEGIRLFQAPIRELESLRTGHFKMEDKTLQAGATPVPEVHGKQLEIIADFQPGSATEFGLRVRKGAGVGTTVGYRVKDGKVFLDRRTSGLTNIPNWAKVYEAPLALENGRIRLHLFVDWSSVEVFANDGREAITCNILTAPDAEGVELYSEGGEAHLVSLQAYGLKSVWRTAEEEKRLAQAAARP
ncbi:MAG: GH32 C-terminal domain-containing protein [Armatimonadota bacterium]|nr:GH32 C-terminal domain-containing protein [Armatimonadota bacterium]